MMGGVGTDRPRADPQPPDPTSGAPPMSPRELWERFQKHYCDCPSLGLSLDISRMPFRDADLDNLRPAMERAYAAMVSLEEGDIANPDENRMVGHYWLRAPELAPTPDIAEEIRSNLDAIEAFAHDVHSGKIRPPKADRFTQVLSIGIGGSALGPEFVADALGDPDTDKMSLHFFDNTDPEGIDRVLRTIGDRLAETLVVVMSKSGGTPETRNGMLLAAEACRKAGLDFPKQAVAVTMAGSKLDKQAESEGWLARFPMWDWVGGRTSELSAVGLVPGFLQGVDMKAVLDGARACDEATRNEDTAKNPAALMALMWYIATGGKGSKDLVVLPYNDRLLLFSRYLQQLVMESLGKRLDLDGHRVDQGLSVYGNKGSTDQHAYVQQLRDGVNNFFVTFIRVLEGRGDGFEVEPGVTAGDYLHGFQLGTRSALFDNDRSSMTLTIDKVEPRTVGILIALFERTVGFYASLININAYHQPGVEAGKKAAAEVLDVQSKVVKALDSTPKTADAVAKAIGTPDAAETVFALLEHLAARGRAKLASGGRPGERAYVAAP
ncbi:MAG: glucose-6-phosphate isomerase [Isosphaeraceae bacterium]